MNKVNFSTWLSVACAALAVVILVTQRQQSGHIQTLLKQQTDFAQASSRQQQELRTTKSELSNQLTALAGTLNRKLDQNEQQAKQDTQALVSQATGQNQKNLQAARGELGVQLNSLGTNVFKILDQSAGRIQDGVVEVKRAVGEQLASNAKLREDLLKAREEREGNFRDMNRRLDNLLESGALFSNKSKPAAEAVSLAKAALAANDRSLAKIYYLSAVNHAPSDFTILQEFSKLVLDDKGATAEDASRLKSVLQVSLYQIPPGRIANTLTLLTETLRKEEAILTAQTPKSVPVNWQERFELLVKTNLLTKVWFDGKALTDRWQRMNEIQESVREEGSNASLLKRVEHEAELTQRVLVAARLCQTLDVILRSLDSASGKPEMMVSLLQTAEGTLGQVWGVDRLGWPEELSSKVEQYPTNIQIRVDQIAEERSREALATVKEELEKAKSDKSTNRSSDVGGPFQRKSKHYERCLTKAADAARGITAARLRKESELYLQEIGKLITVAKRNQFDAYQRWVIGLCADAFGRFDSSWFAMDITTRSNVKARMFFDNSGFARVDQSLLAPETAHLFNDILAKLTMKMNGNGQFSTQRELAETVKMKLEGF